MGGLYDRYVETHSPSTSDQRSEVAKDRDRIVHSGALRRLQRKSQIVGAQTSDFFRTRLTHTLECAQIGRGVARSLPGAPWEEVVTEFDHFPDLVEAICLAHDLGHPPFGHNGELALQEEMRTHCNSLFEGNAQSFRIVTYLEPKTLGQTADNRDRWVGLNLTRTTLRSMCKYPLKETPAMRKKRHPKFGIYEDPLDEEVFSWMWDGDPATADRTLATEILDLADDLAYAVHDFEDGVWSGMIPLYALMEEDDQAVTALSRKVQDRDRDRKGKAKLFPKREVELALNDLLAPLKSEAERVRSKVTVKSKHWAERPFDRSKESRANLKNFCAFLIGEVIEDVTSGGKFSPPSEDVQRRIDLLTGMAWVWMIERSDLATKRYAQRGVVKDLFDGYWKHPEMLPNQEEWQAIVEPGREDDVVWREKARTICDHIAAMTDLYAASVHREMYQAGQTLALQM